MPDGKVITESAAITLHLADITKNNELVPATDSPERSAFLRWLVFLVANIYPTFTYNDDPSRFVSDTSAQEDFSDKVGQYRLRLWKIVEDAVQTGQLPINMPFSALDIYLCVMTRWQPGRDWFAQHCPEIYNIARRMDTHPKLTACWQHNFPSNWNITCSVLPAPAYWHRCQTTDCDCQGHTPYAARCRRRLVLAQDR